MAYDFAGLDWSLAAALSDDSELMSDLRAALIADAHVASDLLRRSRCDANWMTSAHRLKGLAASFGAQSLMRAADKAIDFAPGDPSALRAVDEAIAELERGTAPRD